MKKLLLFLSVIVFLAACGPSKKILTDTTPEPFAFRKISADSAQIYRDNFVNDKSIRAKFKQGMMIPLEPLRDLMAQQGVTELHIFYGKAEFKTPVFIIYGAEGTMKYKGATQDNATQTVYLVYYPCPPNCGKG
ncbi:hypothetical protein [Flavihumibacter petaseus]|uniref:Uncharacterized protein n=1 Tax=Flavihumibacter petaseus NBRC 106054 TaxID=1220578 RepID=A0A0E9MZ12_9BACT|nr:hypothetical protein [Flavihumibacter petaseus]GAO42952.1 hypothetical protein FPE01S_02_00570 [Flavihumibacter petaseus NBRC 106054]